ncbi:DNA mismatch repair protein MutS2 [Bacilli bacterium PM5-3]|nr:DNA mismatch repair protein MutS2 [Bacilli bacterium PM5-3]
MEAFLNQKQRSEIGFEFVLKQLNVLSVYGQELLNTQKAFEDAKTLEIEFDKIETTKEYLNKYDRVIKESEVYFSRIKNIDLILNGLDLICLDEVEIFEIKKFVYNVMNLNKCFSEINNVIDVYCFNDFSKLFEYLDLDNSKMPFFSLYDEYSQELKELRAKQKESDEQKEILKDKIKEEEQKVKYDITNFIAKYQDELIATTKQIAYLDLLIAKAKLANRYGLDKPMIADKMVLKNSYSPYVREVVTEKGYNYIPLNIELEKKVQLITGSNMSGKSVTLKNIILNVLCFQYGIYPFAQEAKLPIVDYIVYISDELQDVENSLSSFGKEVAVLNESLEFIKEKHGLIVLDEFARGTNPIEAKMIVVGLCKYLQTQNIYSILSTHLDLDLDIDYNHYQVAGLSNVQETELSSDDILKVMDYSLMKVDNKTKVPNDAFKVMNFLNLNRELKNIIEKEYEKETNNGQN